MREDDFTFLETVSQLRCGRANCIYFEALNASYQEKTLQKGSVLGSVYFVSASVPMVRSSDVVDLGVDVKSER